MIYSLGSGYYVRALRESDVDGPYPRWFEDQDVCCFNSHGKFFKNLDYFRQYVRSLNGEDKIVWAICHESDGHIGNVSLQSISFVNRNAEFAIILGDSNHRGKGVGKIASSKLIEHGFHKLNLKRIYCGTAATNLAMQSLAKYLGMVEEGRRRQHLFLDGKWVDMLEYGLLREN
jgi:[ribosomal protein S5]-alanine N-acetyltransferase